MILVRLKWYFPNWTQKTRSVSKSLAPGLLSHRDARGVRAGLNVCLLSFPSKAFIAFDKRLQKVVTVPQSLLSAKWFHRDRQLSLVSPSSLVMLQRLHRYYKGGSWQLNSLFQDAWDHFIKIILMQLWLTAHQILVSAGNVCPLLGYSAAFLYLRRFYLFVNVWCYFLWPQCNTFQPAALNRSPSIRVRQQACTPAPFIVWFPTLVHFRLYRQTYSQWMQAYTYTHTHTHTHAHKHTDTHWPFTRCYYGSI